MVSSTASIHQADETGGIIAGHPRDEESTSLLQERRSEHNNSAPNNNNTVIVRPGRGRWIGSLLVAGVALLYLDLGSIRCKLTSSCASPSLTDGVLSITSSASSSFSLASSSVVSLCSYTFDDDSDDDEIIYKSGEFWGGEESSIYILSMNGKNYKSKDFCRLIQNAHDDKAYIIVGDPHSHSVTQVIEAVRDQLGCSRFVTDLDYCPIIAFDYDAASSLVSVENLDDRTPIIEEYLDAPNGLMAVTDAVADTEYLLAVQSMPNITDFSDGELTQPDVLEPHFGPIEFCPMGEPMAPNSTDGVYVLTIEAAEHETNIASTFRTRLMNGKLPGPTIKVKRGQTFRVLFKNKLEQQDGAVNCDNAPNKPCNPDYSNLHYHGGHVSGELPSDDVEYSVTPGGCYSYYTEFPDNHMPGTHWIHPHVHGSSTLQVGGGAALAMIVEDDTKSFPIPPEVETANDVLLFVQDFERNEIDDWVERSFGEEGVTDSVWNLTYSDGFDLPRFRLVNGKFRPNLTIITGEWTRLRVVYAGWRGSSENLRLEFDTNLCETNLLAKDGIYLHDYPRRLNEFPVPTAGRADIMIRCTADVKFNVTQFGTDPLMTIDSTGGSPVIDVGSLKPATENFAWEFPGYLQSVQFENVTDPNCSCTTALSSFNKVNGRSFKKHEAVHTIEFGQLVERKLDGISFHPYHQHVYPFQLTEGYETEENWIGAMDPTHGGYFKNGDWHDVIRSPNQNEATVKYRANVHNGKVMLHCHRLVHEDQGMMSQEHIVDNGKCKCDANKSTNE